MDEDLLMLTGDAARYLQGRGVPVSPATLESKRSRGGGPVFEKVLSRALYRRSALDEWAEKIRSGPLARTLPNRVGKSTGRDRKAVPDAR